MQKLTQGAIDALKSLEVNGVVKCEDVVRAAKSQKSPLHPYFEWDDTEAAQQWRLQQARFIMNVYVEIQPTVNESFPVYVSLNEDRSNKNGGGYRRLDSVMGDVDLRDRYLAQCLSELERLQSRFGHLEELAGVWSAVKTAKLKRSKASV